MSGSTGIEWTDATWNPVTGCTRVSPGCANCYIERTPPFRMEGRRFDLVDGASTTGVRLHPDRLEQPLRWRKPRRVFVNSLSDLFHEDIPFEFIERVYETMAEADEHIFQVLTKRPERAREFYRHYFDCDHGGAPLSECRYCRPWANVWLGVSIENARFTWRADVLREIPAAVRFLSCEPLLGSLFPETTPGGAHGEGLRWPLDLTGIDWVIVGGESGPGARPMHPDWAREIRDACLAGCPLCEAGDVCDASPNDGRRPAFFMKQWGEWSTYRQFHGHGDDDAPIRFGKKRAGRLLDGRIWDEFPARFPTTEAACATS